MKISKFIFACFLTAIFFASCDKSDTLNLEKEKEFSESNQTSALEVLPNEDYELKPEKQDPGDCCIDCQATIQVQLPNPNVYDLWVRGVCRNGDPGPLIGHYDEVNTPNGYIEFNMVDEQIYQFTALSSAGALVIDVTDIFGPVTLTIGDMVFPSPAPPVPPVSNNIYIYEELDCNLYTVSSCYENGERICCWQRQL